MGDVFYIGVAPTIGIAAISLIMAHNFRHTPSSLCSTHRPYIRPLARLQGACEHDGVVILSFASKSDDASSSITEPALQALGAANLQDQ